MRKMFACLALTLIGLIGCSDCKNCPNCKNKGASCAPECSCKIDKKCCCNGVCKEKCDCKSCQCK